MYLPAGLKPEWTRSHTGQRSSLCAATKLERLSVESGSFNSEPLARNIRNPRPALETKPPLTTIVEAAAR
jgi:hypothetical protein